MFRKFLLKNGVRVVTEYIPHVSTVSVGFWVETGARDENLNETEGYAHFIEHMLFKGTKTRTAADIAKAVDKIGAHINGATDKEFTCLYINSKDEYLDFDLELLADIFDNSLFTKEDIEKEKQVVLEEIKMYNDNPDELIHDILIESLLPNHILGKPTIGNRTTIELISQEKLFEFLNSKYGCNNLIISITGKFNFNKLKKQIEKLQIFLSKNKIVTNNRTEPKFSPTSKAIKRDLEQIHFCMGFKGFKNNFDNRYALYLFNNIFGSSMSSHLFQEIREKRGICYSIFSFHNSYQDCGIFGIYCGVSIQNFNQAVELILNEVKKIKKNLISESELAMAKDQLKGHLALSSESTHYRMTRIAKQEMIFKTYFPESKIFKLIDNTKISDIEFVVNNIFENKCNLVAIGNIDTVENLNLSI